MGGSRERGREGGGAPDRRKVAFIDGKDGLKNVGRYLGSRDPNDSDGESNVTQFLRKRGEGEGEIKGSASTFSNGVATASPVQLSTPFAMSHSVNFLRE